MNAIFLAGFRSLLPQGLLFTLAAAALILFDVWALLDGEQMESGKQSPVGRLVGILLASTGFAVFYYGPV